MINILKEQYTHHQTLADPQMISGDEGDDEWLGGIPFVEGVTKTSHWLEFYFN